MKKELTLDEGSPFTDRDPFPEPMVAKVAEYDKSRPYEIDCGAIFKTTKGKYRGVIISGCS